MNRLCKILYFFNFVIIFFLILIKNQLIFTSYKKIKLKKGTKMIKIKNKTWMTCYKFCKRCTLVIKL